VRVAPPPVPVTVTLVAVVTALVVTANCAVVAPAATVTLGGTDATAAFELESVTTSPPLAAAVDSVTVPVAPVPPTTLVGLIARDDTLGAEGAPCTVRLLLLENDPAVPAELTARTRQKSCCAGRPVTVACDAVTVWLRVSGAVKLLESSI
jgi:hypothetical protein